MESLADRIADYSANPLFADAEEDEIFVTGSPFRRPTRTYDNQYINFEKPLTRATQASNSALSTHRMLLNIYEAESLMLPQSPGSRFLEEFNAFYEPSNMLKGERIRADLEKKAFSFLDDEIQISGQWTAASLVAYFDAFIDSEKASRNTNALESTVFKSILNSPDPKRSARHYLVQLAPDFLSEASAMARMAPGAYGPVQSALFNILIDEYGAGVHKNKHSTLFEETLKSVNLKTELHHYWQFYHATSLGLTNYFHYITKNKQHFFKYLGALFYTETSLVNTTKRQSDLLRRVFSDEVNTHYFNEHTHIDVHHGDMALNRVIKPALEQFGDAVAEDILKGFLEFRLLEEIADEDLLTQFNFMNGLGEAAKNAREFYEHIVNEDIDIPLETFVECSGERSTTHVHPDDRLLVIESGSMNFWPLAGEPIALSAGDILFIPKHRLHGSVVTSAECVYHQPIADAESIARIAEPTELQVLN